MAAADA
jgi:hypothetical protein